MNGWCNCMHTKKLGKQSTKFEIVELKDDGVCTLCDHYALISPFVNNNKGSGSQGKDCHKAPEYEVYMLTGSKFHDASVEATSKTGNVKVTD